MKYAIDETQRRRKIQKIYNEKNNIIPKTIKKDIRDITERIKNTNGENDTFDLLNDDIPKEDISRIV